jgi:hypothetical protein
VKIETVTAPGRIFVIGDLHGCLDEALELLDRIAPQPNDAVVFTGDLVDRGPDPEGCVRLARAHHCVLGNHEAKHLRYAQREAAEHKTPEMPPTHAYTWERLGHVDLAYFASLPHAIHLPQHNAWVVHAGVRAGALVVGQDVDDLLHIQMLDPTGRDRRRKWPSKAPADWLFWTNVWRGPERVIFGHTVLDRPLVTEHAVGIDGGCVFGGELWAYELPSGKIHRVKGRHDYGSGSRGRSGRPIKSYRIHGDVSTPS